MTNLRFPKTLEEALEMYEYRRRAVSYTITNIIKKALAGTLVGVTLLTVGVTPAVGAIYRDEVRIPPAMIQQITDTVGVTGAGELDTSSINLEMQVAQKQNQPILVYVDGKQVNFPDQKPYIDGNSRTLVPVRFVSEALGAEVDWVAQRKEVGIEHEAKDKSVLLWVGKSEYTVNGKQAKMDTKAILTPQARVMVPLRFVSEALGAEVHWQVVANNGVVHTFTLGQSKEEVKAIMDRIKAEIEGNVGVKDQTGKYPTYNTGVETYGWVEVDPNADEYGIRKGMFGTGYYTKTSVGVNFHMTNRDEAKVRQELTRIIVLSGYTEAQAKEVVDFAMSAKKDQNDRFIKDFGDISVHSSARDVFVYVTIYK